MIREPTMEEDFDNEPFAGAKPVKPPALPPGHSPPPPPPLAWGSVGVHKAAPTSSGAKSFLVTRAVEGDVEYDPPPLAKKWTRQKDGNEYQMLWPGDPAAAPTLASLARQLRESVADRQQPIERSDSRLARFDRLADGFLQALETLHRNRWTCGLTHPGNVFLDETSKDAPAVLVDLGFRWDGELLEPDWHRSGPSDAYWGETPHDRQNATQADDDKLANDIVVAARILAGTVLGRAPKSPSTSSISVWTTLNRALNGEFASVSEFREAMQDTPLSRHFSEREAPPPSPPPPPKKRNLLPLIAAVVVIAAVGGALAVFWPKTPDPVPAPVEVAKKDPDSPPTKPAVEEKKNPPVILPPDWKTTIEKIDQSKGTDRVGLLKKAYEELKKLAPAEADPIRAKLDGNRGKYLTEWRKQIETLMAEPVDAEFRSIREAGRLIAEFNEFITTYPPLDEQTRLEELKCHDFAKDFLRQLQSSLQ